MRIAHLGKFYPPAPGGIESHVRALAHAQAELGAQVEVLCVNHMAPSGQEVTWRVLSATSDCDEWDGPVHIERLGRIAGVSRLELCPSLLRAVTAVCRRADVVHVHAPNVTMYLALLATRTNAPLIVSHHSDVVKQVILGRLFAPAERRILRRAALVFSPSSSYAAGSARLSQIAEKVRVLPLGIDLTPYQQPSAAARDFARELWGSYGWPLWLCVGRLVYYKGLDVALQALRDAPGRLVIVGRGPLRATLEKLAREMNIHQRLTLLDELSPDQLVGAYLAATALWFPSVARSESFGLVQVEAMASGCPVLNTQIPNSGVPWVSQDGVSGLTVAPGDAHALAVAARQLAESDALRARLSDGGRKRAASEFDARVMGRRSLEYYEQALRARSRPRLEAPASL
jgi:rhamnosyl/mannosyltransferase